MMYIKLNLSIQIVYTMKIEILYYLSEYSSLAVTLNAKVCMRTSLLRSSTYSIISYIVYTVNVISDPLINFVSFFF